MECNGIYYYDISSLPADQQAAFNAARTGTNYSFQLFRTAVLATLTQQFGRDVNPGTKAITVNAGGNRRKADVLVCVEHHKYLSYSTTSPSVKEVGICFFKSDGTKVVNYPRLHAAHLTTKNQNTAEWYKHIVRIFKNGRQKLIDDGAIAAGVAPSYYIEGLLYNVPNAHFGVSYNSSVFNCLKFLAETDRTKFVCANEQYPLLGGNADVTWNSANCATFLNRFVEMWNQW